MKQTVFQGAATALITPFTADGTIDYHRFGLLVDWQIESGIDALVVCGTTGEASTFTDDEHRDAIAFVVERANGRVPVIAGTGQQRHAVRHRADKARVLGGGGRLPRRDALLQ